MSSQLTNQQILIAPARALSSNRLSDHFIVAYWTLWAPLAFARYGRYLRRTEMEAAPPSPLNLEAIDLWRKANPGHRSMEIIVWRVSICMLAGLAAVNALCAAPLFPDAADVAWRQSYLFIVMFWPLLLGIYFFGWLMAVKLKNSGYLYGSVLPGVLLVAILLLLFVRFPYQQRYLANPSLNTVLIFVFCGFGFGFITNYVLLTLNAELRSVFHLLVVCSVPTIVAGLYFIWLVDASAQLGAAAMDQAQTNALVAWVCWTGGFLLGLLQLLEWGLFWLLPMPKAGEQRAWWIPGTTLLPVRRLRGSLREWFDYDWQRTMRITSDLSRVSRQQLPLTQAVRTFLTRSQPQDLPEKLTVVCDSGAVRIADMVRPPAVKPPRGAKKSAAPASPAAKSQQRLQQEVALAEVLDRKRKAPQLQQEEPTDALYAAFWYYSHAYLFEAADVLRDRFGDRSSSGSLTASASFDELNSFIRAYQAMQDLRAVSERPNADLGPRPEHPRRMQAWAIVDQFLDAARWIWRARRCDGQVGRDCYREFNQTLGRIERSARNGSLAERELIIGTIRLWRRQAASLLNDLSGRSTLVQVKLGDWRKVYLELDALCPWRQAEKELLRYWQPGRTEVVYVEEQPFAGAADAVSDAAARNSASTVLVHCDPKRWQDAPISASEFCIFFCTEIAAKLHATDMLPDEAVLRSLDAAALRDLVEKLCAADPNRSVVLFIENLHLLEEALTPKTDWERAIDFLDRIEDEIGNLALTVHSCDGDYVWQRFQNQCKSPHLFRPVPVRLLPLDGVEQWLDRLFSTTGLYFTEEAHAETYRITGGHPFLLASLANCIAADYNGQVSSAPICPRIDAQQVTAAATAKRYQADARRFSTAFARQLDHDTDSERRLLLYLLARATRRGATDCTSRILSNDSAPYDQLSVPAIEAILGPWIDSEVVTTKLDGGDVNYTLRIFSFAEWVAGEKPTINNLT